MKAGKLVQNSSRHGWNVKGARYISEDKVVLEFEKPFSQIHDLSFSGFNKSKKTV